MWTTGKTAATNGRRFWKRVFSLKSLQALRRLPALGLGALLEALERQLSRRGQAASLRLHLASGHSVQGLLVRYSAEQGTLLLQQGESLSWVSTTSLLAVEVLEASAWVEALEGVPNEPDDAPTRLELKRLAEPLRPPLEIAWDQLPQDPQSARHLASLLRGLRSLLDEWQQDPVGREALSELTAFRMVFVSEPTPLRRRDQFVDLPMVRGSEGLLEVDLGQLRRELEKLL